MIITPLASLPEVKLVTNQPEGEDTRGFVKELFQAKRFRQAGLPADFIQDNLSRSTKGVLRGLHFQHPGGQDKLIQVLEGEIFDVAVDIRRGSPSFAHWASTTLDDSEDAQLLVPRGFAHGFCVLSETALVLYKCSSPYAPGNDHALRWDDPEIGINWPIERPLLSERDASAPALSSIGTSLLPSYGEGA